MEECEGVRRGSGSEESLASGLRIVHGSMDLCSATEPVISPTPGQGRTRTTGMDTETPMQHFHVGNRHQIKDAPPDTWAFALVRLEPPILLRRCCDRRNRRGLREMAYGAGLTRGAQLLTHRTIETLRPVEAPYRVPDQRCKGLAVRVAPSGVKTWDLAYRIRGTSKMRRLSLGRTTDVSLEQARERANELTSAARGGRDLVAEEEDARGVAASRVTVEKLIDPLFATPSCWPLAHSQVD